MTDNQVNTTKERPFGTGVVPTQQGCLPPHVPERDPLNLRPHSSESCWWKHIYDMNDGTTWPTPNLTTSQHHKNGCGCMNFWRKVTRLWNLKWIARAVSTGCSVGDSSWVSSWMSSWCSSICCWPWCPETTFLLRTNCKQLHDVERGVLEAPWMGQLNRISFLKLHTYTARKMTKPSGAHAMLQNALVFWLGFLKTKKKTAFSITIYRNKTPQRTIWNNMSPRAITICNKKIFQTCLFCPTSLPKISQNPISSAERNKYYAKMVWPLAHSDKIQYAKSNVFTGSKFASWTCKPLASCTQLHTVARSSVLKNSAMRVWAVSGWWSTTKTLHYPPAFLVFGFLCLSLSLSLSAPSPSGVPIS